MDRKEHYAYPAILTFYPDEDIEVVFPDLHAVTQGQGEDGALRRAKDCLGLALLTLQEEGKQIPEPSQEADIVTDPGQQVYLVDVDMTDIRADVDMTDIRAKAVNVG